VANIVRCLLGVARGQVMWSGPGWWGRSLITRHP
jgi:hypothetical protein